MPVFVEWKDSGALVKKLAAVERAASEGGKATNRLKGDLRKIVTEDHIDKMLRGVDRHGRPRAPLAPSTLANPRRGPGPSLVPRGMASRFIANFETLWEKGTGGAAVLVCRFRNIVDRRGRSFSQYHLTGTRRMPKRDVGGITPKGWSRIQERFHKHAADVLVEV